MQEQLSLLDSHLDKPTILWSLSENNSFSCWPHALISAARPDLLSLAQSGLISKLTIFTQDFRRKMDQPNYSLLLVKVISSRNFNLSLGHLIAWSLPFYKVTDNLSFNSRRVCCILIMLDVNTGFDTILFNWFHGWTAMAPNWTLSIMIGNSP